MLSTVGQNNTTTCTVRIVVHIINEHETENVTMGTTY